MTGPFEQKPQDAEEALIYAFNILNTRQQPRFLAESVIEVLARAGIELTVREIEPE